MERANGIEPSTLTLARLCSTAELRPHMYPCVVKVERETGLEPATLSLEG